MIKEKIADVGIKSDPVKQSTQPLLNADMAAAAQFVPPAAKVAAPATVDQLFGAMHDTAMVVGKVDPNSTVSLLYNRDTFKLKATWKKQDQSFQFVSRSISPGTPVPTILDIITEFGVQLVEQVK